MNTFAEQTIVHGGLQSMPMSYDNAVGKSEATLTLMFRNLMNYEYLF